MKDLSYHGKKEPRPFDYKRNPRRQNHFWNFVAYTGAFFILLGRKHKIKKIDMDKIKGPFILLCNHYSFTDFLIVVKALYPKKYNWVASAESFMKLDWGLRRIGGFPKRRYLHDNVSMIRNMKYCLTELKQTVVFFPEGHYSIAGYTGQIPTSLPKILKIINAPIVTLKMQGNFIDTPFYSPRISRKLPLQATLKGLFTAQELQATSNEEIHAAILAEITNDDYRYQKENNIINKYKKNAVGLEKLLYKCPSCKSEFNMASEGNTLSCKICNNQWIQQPTGELKASNSKDIFTHIPDWYKWQITEVQKEIDAGTYKISGDVQVECFFSGKGTVEAGKGFLSHDSNGFEFTCNYRGEAVHIKKLPHENYSVHVELVYNLKSSELVDITEHNRSFFCYFPRKVGEVIKIRIATELLYAKTIAGYNCISL